MFIFFSFSSLDFQFRMYISIIEQKVSGKYEFWISQFDVMSSFDRKKINYSEMNAPCPCVIDDFFITEN